MAFDNQQGGGFQKQMYPVDVACSGCGAKITELPFQPDPNRVSQILCRDCHRQKRDSMGGGQRGTFQKQMYPVDVACSGCGAKITELPFQPDPARVSQILCRDCHRNKRQSF